MSPRVKLSLLLLVLVSPLIASYVTYYFWKPTSSSHYGELQTITPLPIEKLQSLDKKNAIDEIKGKWTFVTIDSGKCEQACKDKLYFMRQIRLMQGKHMDRISRVFIVDDAQPVSDDVKREYEGMAVVKNDPQFIEKLPSKTGLNESIFLLDPLGNLVLRYSANPDPKGVMKDITRLLKASSIG
jgi:cytochrome oxidase Cu insertion factor (SCO1/SenC/PrrC family)